MQALSSRSRASRKPVLPVPWNHFQPRATHPGQSKPRARASGAVSCWLEVEKSLLQLAQLTLQLGTLERAGAEARARLESEISARRAPLESQRVRLERAIEKFCRRHDELARIDGHARKSRTLRFGRVGYRTARAVSIQDEARALRALANWRPGQQFLRVRTELDRDSLRQFFLQAVGKNGPGARVRRRLQRAGVRLQQREKWFYELNWEALKRWEPSMDARQATGRGSR
ncbi:MAG TPA: host-nuclease inhibitor Gam family protein [Candidatus Xenobia bacterium]|nr:host-nuclease inhibitor Gam family protein [Candidatus Xenobia bacterium]